MRSSRQGYPLQLLTRHTWHKWKKIYVKKRTSQSLQRFPKRVFEYFEHDLRQLTVAYDFNIWFKNGGTIWMYDKLKLAKGLLCFSKKWIPFQTHNHINEPEKILSDQVFHENSIRRLNVYIYFGYKHKVKNAISHIYTGMQLI